jgi:hypothetical protein
VYLHDTSSPSLFARDERAFSHGCVRVEKRLELAAFALAETPGWSRESVSAATHRGGERAVSLAEPIPVYVFYRTAWEDEQGAVHFRRDLYALDARLERARLALAVAGAARAREGSGGRVVVRGLPSAGACAAALHAREHPPTSGSAAAATVGDVGGADLDR